MEQVSYKLALDVFTRTATGELLLEDSHPDCQKALEHIESLHLYIIPMAIDPKDPKNSTKRKGPYLLPTLATNYLLRHLSESQTGPTGKQSLDQCVFDTLTKQGFFVTEEQNFGARFAIYEGSPNLLNNHARFLVFTQDDPKLYFVSRVSTLLKKQVSHCHPGSLGHLGINQGGPTSCELRCCRQAHL